MLNFSYRILRHIFFSIFFGLFIYVFWRGIYIIDPSEQIFPLFPSMKIPGWIKYNVPDGLWLYAFLSALFFIWKEKFSGQLFIWLILAIFICFFFEISQAYGIFPGTFDWYDMLAYSIASTFFFFNFHQINNQLLLTLKIKKN